MTQTTKTYTFATVSKTGNVAKVKFTNNALTRTKRLKNDGVKFTKLPRPMSKLEAAKYLMQYSEFKDDPATEAAVQRVVNRFALTAPKEKKESKSKKPAKKASSKKPAAKKAETKPAKEKAPVKESKPKKPRPSRSKAAIAERAAAKAAAAAAE